MFNIGGGEVLVILLIALIVLGPDKLPNAARQAGKYLGDFRRMSTGFQRELRDAMDLGDLGDLMSGTSKPQSTGGPVVQPTAVSPSADASPVDAGAAPAAAASPSTSGASTPTTAASTASTDTSGSGDADVRPAPTGNGTGPAVVRKGMIEVDGPSSSFG
jgi:sec-independent protein translocase protein TatB